MLGQTDEDCSVANVSKTCCCFIISAHGNVLKYTYCDMPLLYMLINQSELTLD